MNKLLVRALSGAVYVALIVGAVLAGTYWFAALMSLFCVLAVIEFENILDGGHPAGTSAWIARVLDIAAALAVTDLGLMPALPDWCVPVMAAVIVLYPLARFVTALYDKRPGAFASVGHSVLALLYIAVPLLMLNLLYSDTGHVSAMIVLAMFIMIWLNDTGAFCVGSLCGRHRLYERLSPKKSWEGFFGGLACCLIAGAVCSHLLPEARFGLWGWLGFSVIVCVLSTWGDLFESLMKRTSNIKDSGRLIPGHGGILDRIDSLLFVAAGSFLFYTLFY